MTLEATVDELEQARTAGATLIDVREPDEWARARVPGAELMPLGTVRKGLDRLPRNETVYVVCASGNRSLRAAQLLTKAGIDARSVAGGTSAWMRSGRPVETGRA